MADGTPVKEDGLAGWVWVADSEAEAIPWCDCGFSERRGPCDSASGSMTVTRCPVQWAFRRPCGAPAGQSHLKELALGFGRRTACEAGKRSKRALQSARYVAGAAEKGLSVGENVQGLKPDVVNAALTARVNSCPDTNHLSQGVFPQPEKPGFFL